MDVGTVLLLLFLGGKGMDISRKSIGMLIDELITTNIKCFMLQETVCNATSDEEVADAAKKVQQFNARRNSLIRAIDILLGDDDIMPSEKTYE